MTLRWFFSQTVRQAAEMRNHVRKILCAQRDLLTPKAIEEVDKANQDISAAITLGLPNDQLKIRMTALEETANKWLKPFPYAAWRENVEVILVAVAIAMGIRTFFLQPMKIPTGSMQPTLYGITYQNLKDDPKTHIPNGLQKWFESIFLGTSYYHYTAKTDGTFKLLDSAPQRVIPFFNKQRFSVGDAPPETVWSPGDQLFRRAELFDGKPFHKGDDIIKMKVVSGDHLFVNRMAYNFRKPKRGEIVIFETRGIQDLPQDTYYIKRLIAIGDDKVQIGNDHHVIINGQRYDANTPHFENLYTFGTNYLEDHYFGHVNQVIGGKFGRPGALIAPLFRDETTELTVRPNHCLVMGDNTMNSFDSRYWGDFPRENIIGKSSFVYWPISKRFGWAHW